MSNQPIAPENIIAQIQDGETTHYICQNGSELTERSFDGELSPPELLGTARPGTSGAYLLLGDKRTFYCLDESDFLQDFQYDDEEGEWTRGQLATLKVKAAVKAEIAAITTAVDGTIYVFFQNPSGAIQSLGGDASGEWHPATYELPSMQPTENASIYAMTMNDAVIHVFYTNQDNFIHELVFDSQWSDNRVALTDSDSKKSSIVVTPDENGSYTLQFTNAEGEVYVVHNGELTFMGKYVHGIFHKDKGAEGWNTKGPRVVRR